MCLCRTFLHRGNQRHNKSFMYYSVYFHHQGFIIYAHFTGLGWFIVTSWPAELTFGKRNLCFCFFREGGTGQKGKIGWVWVGGLVGGYGRFAEVRGGMMEMRVISDSENNKEIEGEHKDKEEEDEEDEHNDLLFSQVLSFPLPFPSLETVLFSHPFISFQEPPPSLSSCLIQQMNTYPSAYAFRPRPLPCQIVKRRRRRRRRR